MKKTLALTILIAILICCVFVPLVYAEDLTPAITTDKVDYAPEETVLITGSGFNSFTYYDIPVIRPDGSIVVGDGSFMQGWDDVNTDASNRFTYEYILDGIFGLYEVRVYNSPWSGDLSEPPIASITFTDGPVGNLLKSHEVWDPDPSVLNWVPGHPKGYSESDVAAFRVTIGSVPTHSS